MIYFKSCPRCKGDVHLGSDAYGAFLSCLQCGFVWDMRQPHRQAAAVADARLHAEVAYAEQKAS